MRRASYRRGDWAIVCGSALGGEVDAVGSLELDLKGSCGSVSRSAQSSMNIPDLRQCGRSPC